MSEEDSLVIDPGVTVKFLGDYKITVLGTLSAQGTEADSITFMCDTSQVDRWSGIRFIKSQPSELKYCEFIHASNPYPDSFYVGGAVFVDSSQISVQHCSFQDNHAGYGGAVALFRPLSGSTIDSCIFTGNSAVTFNEDQGFGGALSIRSAAMNVTHCLFSDNHARTGAAIATVLTDVTYSNCTFIDNFADVSGHVGHVAIGTTSLNSCIIDGDGLVPTFQLESNSAFNSEYCDYFQCPGGLSNLPPPAGFGVLSEINFNGDSVDTYGNLFRDPLLTIEHELVWNSPCLDAGDPAFAFDPDGSPADQGWRAFFQPTLVVEPETLDFGSILFGDSAVLTCSIINPSVVDAPIISQFNSLSVFHVDTMPSWIAAGDTVEISVACIPVIEGSFSDTLLITSRLAGPDVLRVPLIVHVPIVPADVDSLVVTRGADNIIHLNWQPVTRSTSGQLFTPSFYTIYAATSVTSPFTVIGSSAAASFSHMLIAGQSKYFYQVTATAE